jgi:hypothetical protein
MAAAALRAGRLCRRLPHTIEGDCIAELWDVGQAQPQDMVNELGMFLRPRETTPGSSVQIRLHVAMALPSSNPRIRKQSGMTTFTTRREVAALPAAVFAAIRDPDRLAKWRGPDGFTNRFKSFEFRPGGQRMFDMVGPDGLIVWEQAFGDAAPACVDALHAGNSGGHAYER